MQVLTELTLGQSAVCLGLVWAIFYFVFLNASVVVRRRPIVVKLSVLFTTLGLLGIVILTGLFIAFRVQLTAYEELSGWLTAMAITAMTARSIDYLRYRKSTDTHHLS